MLVPGETVKLSRVQADHSKTVSRMFGGMSGARDTRPNVVDEKGMEQIGAPAGGWDASIKKTKDIEWKHGERMTVETWESLHPRIARDFYQQLGSHLYSLLIVWLGKAFNVLVKSVPNDDGFGLYELLVNETQVRNDDVAQRWLEKWEAAEQGSSSEQRSWWHVWTCASYVPCFA